MMKVAVIGAGVMGSGIALCSIQAGYPTVLFDVNETALQRGMDYIQTQLNVAVSKGKTTQEKVDAALLLLSATPNRETLVADFIIEAVLEQLPIKRELFQFLETINSEKTLFATNTSSIPITQIAAAKARESITLPLPAALTAVAAAAEAGKEASKAMIAQFGRAKTLGEACLGFPDAGACSVVIMLNTMRDYANV